MKTAIEEARRGMKERELRKHATCALCNRKVLESGLPLFWTFTVERHGVLVDAVRRQGGLTELLGGNAAIAAAMGPDEDMTQRLAGPITLSVCEPCAMESPLALRALAEEG